MADKPSNTGDRETLGEPAHRPGQTKRTTKDDTAPKMPHERDESASSQQQIDPSDLMRTAKADVDRGLVDTSRAEATDETYGKNLRSEPQGAPDKPAAPKPR